MGQQRRTGQELVCRGYQEIAGTANETRQFGEWHDDQGVVFRVGVCAVGVQHL
jgi:hypothetical protein